MYQILNFELPIVLIAQNLNETKNGHPVYFTKVHE